MNTSCFITVGNIQVTLFKIFGLGLFILFCVGCVLPEYKCVLYLCAWCPQRQVHVIWHGTKITRDCVKLCRYWDCSWGLCKSNNVLSLVAISLGPQAILDFSNLSIAKEFPDYQLGSFPLVFHTFIFWI